jgi:uncharacterized protein
MAGLLDRRNEIVSVAAKFGATNVRVFGSVARGEMTASSDLDLLVRMDEGTSLFDLVGLSQELEEALGVNVDVLSEGGLSPYLRDRILSEAVALCRTSARTCCICATRSTEFSPTRSQVVECSWPSRCGKTPSSATSSVES